MIKHNTDQPAASSTFTAEELLVINNALNEVCHGVDFNEDEFLTRVGFSKDRVSAVLAKVNALVKKSK